MTEKFDDVVSIRKMVIKGDISSTQKQLAQWKVPKWSLSIFVSSTFTDTIRERNELMGPILNEFRELAQTNSIELVFVDMFVQIFIIYIKFIAFSQCYISYVQIAFSSQAMGSQKRKHY